MKQTTSGSVLGLLIGHDGRETGRGVQDIKKIHKRKEQTVMFLVENLG